MAVEDYGIKISKVGFDIRTCAVKDQSFNSSYNNFKIISEGAINVSVPTSGGAQYTITHSLGYVPGFIIYGELSSNAGSLLVGSNDPNGAGEGFQAKATTTTIVIDIDSNGVAGYTAELYYYIIADPAL